MLMEVGFDAIGEQVALLLGERGGHELHDGWVAVEAGEGFAVGGVPAAECEAVCLHGGHGRSVVSG